MKIHDEKISIIIPVYNAQAYISETIESVLRQTYTNWELILVDNMSGDRSLEICRTYEEKYDNIFVYQEGKKGVSHARNCGLKHAAGEYFVFVDADDLFPDENVLKRYVIAMKRTNADIVVGNYERLWKGKHLAATSNEVFSEKDRESKDFRFQGFFSVGTLSYVWGKMYRREFLEKNHIMFGNYSYSEDQMFNLYCYINGARYAFLQAIGYTYRMNSESISFCYREDARENWLSMAHDLDLYLQKYGKQNEWSDLVDALMLFATFFNGKMEYTRKSTKATVRLLKAYGMDPLGRKCFKRRAFGASICSSSLLMWKLAIRIYALGMSLHLYYLWAVLIKLLVDFRIDERLSDIGVRE